MSYRTDNTAGYDQSLLSSVPGPTRAEKQEGYNVGLLEEGRDLRAPTPPNGVVPDQIGTTLDHSPGAVNYARKEGPLDHHLEAVAQKVPWYRRRWGIIGIVAVVLLIIGAAVGGAVGGTRHSSHPQKAVNGTGNSTSSSGSGGNGTTGVGQNASQGTQGNVPAAPPSRTLVGIRQI